VEAVSGTERAWEQEWVEAERKRRESLAGKVSNAFGLPVELVGGVVVACPGCGEEWPCGEIRELSKKWGEEA
jgi:hypothetical protein